MARITRIALDIALDASKSLKSASAIAWQYLKVEAVPPMTLGFFHGSGGKALENAVSNVTDKFISSVQNQIKEIEAEKIREIRRKEAAARAAQEKVKAEAKRKAVEAEKLKAKAQKKAEAQKAQAKKKEVPETKTESVKSAPKKKPGKKMPKKT